MDDSIGKIVKIYLFEDSEINVPMMCEKVIAKDGDEIQ